MIVPAISLWQPWAWLLFTPHKVHETRHWRAPERYIGRRIAIHAAKKRVPEDDLEPIIVAKLDAAPPLAFGALLGTAVLAEVRSMRDYGPAHDMDRACGYWAPDRFAWRMEDAKLFDEPIPMKGQQGFWSVEVPLAA